jgi:heat shock protein
LLAQVPSFFTCSQRRALLAAAEVGGLKVQKLLNDGTAAALAYYHCKQNELPIRTDRPHNVFFVNMGHSSLQVSAASFTKNGVKVNQKHILGMRLP